ncbi:TPA: GTPase-associated system all-helical protein GASH [Vibrio parahaemolyticus]
MTATETTTELPLINSDFSEYMAPTQLVSDRESFVLRWKTLHRLFIEREIDVDDWLDDLIASALGVMSDNPEVTEKLRNEIRADDPVFPGGLESNLEELKHLSTYALRLISDKKYWPQSRCSVAATKILAASFNRLRDYKGGRDLSDYVDKMNFNYVRDLRDLSSLSAPSCHFSFSDSNKEALDVLKGDTTASITDVQDAVVALEKELNRQLSSAQTRLKTFTDRLNDAQAIATEELEALWFINLGWSDVFDTSYDDLSLETKIFDAALSLADRTELDSELPSLKALGHKLGVSNESVSFREWIEEVSNKDWEIDFDEASELTPCLLAIKYAQNGNWYKRWKDSIGIDSKFDISVLDLLQQVYRELLVLRW